jgi:4-hydroxythreonine-4-phosphate dehydrogenase
MRPLDNRPIQDFSINKPKIAVLGLNPHCGDGGVIGKEDDDLLKPVPKSCLKRNFGFGPFAAMVLVVGNMKI